MNLHGTKLCVLSCAISKIKNVTQFTDLTKRGRYRQRSEKDIEKQGRGEEWRCDDHPLNFNGDSHKFSNYM
jgi:hypothetical protein